MTTWLTDPELRFLTNRRRPSAQARVLRAAGIPFRMIDGRPIVERGAVVASQDSRPQVRILPRA